MSIRLSSIHIYPLKSCAPLALDAALVEPRGLANDRRWMVVGADGRFLTGREHPRLTLIRALPIGAAVQLDAPGAQTLLVQPPAADAVRVEVRIWDDSPAPLLAGAAAHAWLEDFLGIACRLVYMDADCVRPVDPDYAQADDAVSFADGFPMLLISQAALDHLNGKLAQPISMLRFRPNLVVSGTAAHAEDSWKRVRIGALEFDLVKSCTRCVFTTVDFERGERDPSGEPLRKLIGYRRTPQGITFGQNVIPRGAGMLRVNDPVEIIA